MRTFVLQRRCSPKRAMQLKRKADEHHARGKSAIDHDKSSVPERPVRRAPAADPQDSLQQYFGDLKQHDVLSAQEELAMAQEIERLEIGHWHALLTYAPALPLIAAAVKEHVIVPNELVRLRKQVRPGVARARNGALRSVRASATRHDATLLACATKLRELDVDRAAVRAANAAVQKLGQERAARGYLSHVARARTQETAIKNKLATANLRLVVSMARRYDRGMMPLSDLIQEGNLGLMRAVERFDHRRGFRFSTYAAWWIRHGFNRALSDKARLVRVPVHALDDAARVARESQAALARTGQLPTPEELSEKLGLPKEKLELLSRHARRADPVSLDRKLSNDGEATLLDVLAAPEETTLDEQLDAPVWSAQLERAMAQLPPIESAILRYRFGFEGGRELTLHEVGMKYNLSRERIRQLQEQALSRLAAALRSERRDHAA
jgi:RNA polymerase primary sigma factor